MSQSFGSWAVSVVWTMARQPSDSQTVCIGVGGGCSSLGGPVPRHTDDTFKWVPAMLVAAGEVSPSSGPWEEYSGAYRGGWGRAPEPQMACLGPWGRQSWDGKACLQSPVVHAVTGCDDLG